MKFIGLPREFFEAQEVSVMASLRAIEKYIKEDADLADCQIGDDDICVYSQPGLDVEVFYLHPTTHLRYGMEMSLDWNHVK